MADRAVSNLSAGGLNLKLVELGDGTYALAVVGQAGDVNIGNVDVASIAAGSNIIGKIQPFAAILEGGLTELVGINEQVDQNEYSASVGVALGDTYSGEILGIALYSTEDGSGSVQTPTCKLFILDADPASTAGDTALAAAEWVTVIGRIDIDSSEWESDANGAMVYKATPVPFHALSTLYLVLKNKSATGINDAAGDDEQIECNLWYRRDS